MESSRPGRQKVQTEEALAKFGNCELWDGQSWPQPLFRRLLVAASESWRAPMPADSRLQPELAAPRKSSNHSGNFPSTSEVCVTREGRSHFASPARRK